MFCEQIMVTLASHNFCIVTLAFSSDTLDFLGGFGRLIVIFLASQI